LEEKKLLRALICITGLLPSAAFSQHLPDATTHGALIDERMEEADAIGEDLQSRLQLLQQEFDLPEDLTQRALDSLENGRVREMLNIGPDDLPDTADDAKRYPGGVYVFASFSMPEPSLKAVLTDASILGIPVVFNGFVDNSVIATEARVRSIYEGSDISHGFIIDPTLFTRFDVKAVPTVVSTTVDLDVCVTSGCAEDGVPDHDRIAGNVPLRTLLSVIARGDTPNAVPVRVILEDVE
jgi:conjugal transfer pilus assembly protein TrbC